MDIKEALKAEIAATKEKLEKLKEALRALDGGARYSVPRKKRHYVEGTAPALLHELMTANFEPGQTYASDKVYELAEKFHKMPRGTVSSAMNRLFLDGTIKKPARGLFILVKPKTK